MTADADTTPIAIEQLRYVRLETPDLAAAAGFAQFLPFVKQQNVEWVLLLLPVHWALLRTLDPKTE